MQITINLPKDLEQNPIQQAAQLNISLETLILQSLHQLTQTTQNKISGWSDTILSYKGASDFPAFESYRDQMHP